MPDLIDNASEFEERHRSAARLGDTIGQAFGPVGRTSRTIGGVVGLAGGRAAGDRLRRGGAVVAVPVSGPAGCRRGPAR